MNKVGGFVVRAVAPGEQGTGREAAFEELVRRFQDVSVAWALARLGDRGLAEDAAQEAFVRAWLNLGQLRTPDAFPGWFRQILFRECGRVAARRRPDTESLGDVDVAGPEAADPFLAAERMERGQSLLAAVRRLPEHERVVVLMYYGADCSQREIAVFLGVATNTVKQRLHSARTRLRGRLEVMAEELRENRPSRDETFLEGMRLRLQRFGGDYARLAKLVDESDATVSAEHLDAEEDRVVWLANRQTFHDAGLIPSAYTVESANTGERLAYGCIERVDLPRTGDYPPTGRPGTNTYRVHLIVTPDAIGAGAVDELYQRLEADAVARGAQNLWCRDTSEHPDVVDYLRGRGFEVLRRVHEWHLVVGDWAEAPSPRPSPSREKGLNDDDVTVTTLTQERQANPDYLLQMHEFWNLPDLKTVSAQSFSLEEIEERLSRPYVVPESYFIAKQGGRILGVLSVRRAHASTPLRPDFYFWVYQGVDVSAIAGRLLDAAADYGREHSYRTITAHFLEDFDDVEFLQGLGLRPSIDLIVLEKRLKSS